MPCYRLFLSILRIRRRELDVMDFLLFQLFARILCAQNRYRVHFEHVGQTDYRRHNINKFKSIAAIFYSMKQV